MSSKRFEDCLDEYRSIYDDLKYKIREQIPKCVGEEKKRIVRDVERGFEDANALISEMDAEAKAAPLSFRSQMTSQLRTYRRELDQLERDMKRGNTGFGGRDELFRGNDFEGIENAQKARLLKGTESLARGTESIARSHRIAAETDQIAVETIDELGNQREALLRTRERLVETQSNLSKSRRILNNMARTIMTNKMILVVIILVELGILAGVVYWKFFSGKKKN